MLDDAFINFSYFNKGISKYSMTMVVYFLNYLQYLNENFFSKFTNTKLYVYPNNLLPLHKGK
jgi:hypothetical protein